MESLKELYRIGYGPSSSHTMGPANAILKVNNTHPSANKYVVTFFNSLALTGLGHLTFDSVIKAADKREVIIKKEIDHSKHPNYLLVDVYENDIFVKIYGISSVGGGKIVFDNEDDSNENKIYKHHSIKEIKKFLLANKMDYKDYVNYFDKDIDSHLKLVWKTMKVAVERGIKSYGYLPGDLKVTKKAQTIYYKRNNDAHLNKILVASYAYAVSEENASGNLIVTAPTCGACGVLPAILYYLYKHEEVSEDRIIDSLKVAGLFGNLIKHNASISGAVAGCQAEIGSACSMGAAAYAYLNGASLDQIEYAAEMAMEHHLGLTCDPINGYVQIPCIERNAHGALRAIDCGILSQILVDSRKISFDMVVETMYKTGLDMHTDYKETSAGGLAYFYKDDGDVNCW